MSTPQIDVAALASFDVAPDGSLVRLHVLDRSGQPTALVLPLECIQQLLMTVPTMLQKALCNSYGDDTLKLVHPLESFSLELGEPDARGRPQFIFTLKTEGSFAVSFSASEQTMTEVGRSIFHDIPDELPSSKQSALLS